MESNKKPDNNPITKVELDWLKEHPEGKISDLPPNLKKMFDNTYDTIKAIAEERKNMPSQESGDSDQIQDLGFASSNLALGTTIEEGTWVTVKESVKWPVRYVTKLNADGKTFTDDGKYSKQQPSNYCHLDNYEMI